MLIVTGVLIGFVLVVMVGQTARTMQGTRLAADHARDDRAAVLGRPVVRRLPDVGDAARRSPRRVRDRLLLLAQEVKVKRPKRRRRSTSPGEPAAAEEREPAGV